jgi:hypothetical protein
MLKIRVKNKSAQTVRVPLSTLVPQSTQAVEMAAPEAEASCVFAPHVASAQAQDAVLAWAATEGVVVEVVIDAAPLVESTPDPPTPGVISGPSNPLGL